ncbi:MAG: dienelactone hydrolase family protein [Planctomycetes bacterium]|nr:dienelactone hydrolase family protein [Planctomycetota bacterium]
MTQRTQLALAVTILVAACASAEEASKTGEPLAGTKPLMLDGDLASHLVAGVDKFLLRELEKSIERRAPFWKRDSSSPEAYNKSIEPNRKRLAHMLGVRDTRVPFDAPEFIATTKQSALVGKGDGYNIFAIRWPVLSDPDPGRDVVTIHGEGLLLVPTKRKPVADVIAIPNGEQTPEQIAGLQEGGDPFAQRLAERGFRVIVPMLINRQEKTSKLTNREWLYRSSFELGRHLIGYEVQKVLALVDWLDNESRNEHRKSSIGVIGHGDGGAIAIYAAALDTRVQATCVSGYFDSRQTIWEQPLDRNVFGLLREFGDAELATMIAPRYLAIEVLAEKEQEIEGGRGAPAKVTAPRLTSVQAEIRRAQALVQGLSVDVKACDRVGQLGVVAFVKQFDRGENAASDGDGPRNLRKSFDPAARHARQMQEIDQHNQLLLRESSFVRRDYLNMSWMRYDKKDGSNKLDTSSVENYEKAIERYRRDFREDVIGRFDIELLDANPRTRQIGESDKWTRYDVVLDVFPDVIAYGILTLPKGMKADERRPVVVCQHGLEGRPQSVIGEEQFKYYKAFATDLAERGFITFAPQNLYIFRDRFRTLQRKANPLGKTLFSIMVPQHQQIVNWLKSLSNVDGKRIAFYGLSYGGKSAMRIPALVTDYCLSICSADFNEWVRKNASTRHPFSYMRTGEYEIFEFDLGSTFNYAEMAALIAPRPFMVERGHADGVGWDEWVAYEFAKVRHLYAARLHIPDRCAIEWFDGPHSINSKGTFEFLHKHLDWPKPGER